MVATQIKEMEDSGEESSDIWCLRKEYKDASIALRDRKIDHVIERSSSSPVEETSSMRTRGEETVRRRRPGLVYRNTDPCPMREFVRNNLNKETNISNMGKMEEDINKINPVTISEDDGDEDLKKNVSSDEHFLISSYDLAKRRLSLPIPTVSIAEQAWNDDNSLFEESDETDNVSLETPVKSTQRLSCTKQLRHSPNMNQRRRQSAWARTPSINTEINKSISLSKRRMSELPALSTLATRRRNLPHTLSLPLGLRRSNRRTSRGGNASDYQSLNNSCLKAKNEMLATLSLSAWSENVSIKHSEISRRKSVYTGFGIMALKKKEEKRLMVAREILQTEKNYITALETLHEVFAEPLKSSCVIPEKDIKTMFPKQLLAMKHGHERFMNELDERLNNWKWQGVLGDIFAKLGNSYHVDFMTLYSEYVNNFPKAIAVINKYTRNSQKFKRFLEKCTNDPRCQRLNISAFLLTPIQRLPRYVLLLRQLAKYTDPNHPDSFHIEISLEKMIHIINILNNSIQNSTRCARNANPRRTARQRKKRRIFKPKETLNTDIGSPRKSSDDSEWSEASNPPTPHAQDLSPLTIDTTSPTADQKSSGYASLTNSETPSEPRSPSPTGATSPKNTFLKVILRNSSESKRNKRRPLSTTEVEIIRKKNYSQTLPKDELTRSVSRDSIGSMIRHKFGSLRRRPRSSDENLDKNLSLERLHECRSTLSKYRRPTSPGDDSFNELNECSKSDSDLIEEKNSEGLNSTSSTESCNESREHLTMLREKCHSDSDDSTSHPDSPLTSRLEGDVMSNNNHDESLHETDGELTKRKLRKRNSFTNAVRFFFVSKTRSSSSSPERVIDCRTSASKDQLHNSQLSKEKISTV
ncbi:rhoGEF domain-containing protein gxcJ-like isoform X2 [Dendronephthya gigantea]|uniref:rhoGEF domain-containing protein gxcJ-like isoform X2 n=1 Tax=Dendronephthya gigantea TaxID=151771 RepID=UPI00106A5B09|nr:rhoGEF domain-containing protein gxcJ-like isoform X2 [Dendronephthya gigantea]